MKTFLQSIKEGIFVLDGATGSNLFEKGLRGCPEQWVIENPQHLQDLQKQYVQAGSMAVYSCTMGANRIKLAEYGFADRTIEMNKELVKISRGAVGNNVFIGGGMGPTGGMMAPMGDLVFEDVVSTFKEQAQALSEAGADFIVIETMMDMQETRAALLGAKEACDLPVVVSMTLEQNGFTLTGTDPVTLLITLQSMGADVVGLNCSAGPMQMLPHVQKMAPYAKVPLLIKPNAGLPQMINGKTVFDMSPDAFASAMREIVVAGASVIGGCCGTTPAHIQAMVRAIEDVKPFAKENKPYAALTGSRKTVFLGENLCKVGERINPTGKKKLQASLRAGETDEALELALKQKELGADILDVNVGTSGVDEIHMLPLVVEEISGRVQLPLCIDTVSIEALEAALRIYPGRALINSISAEDARTDRLLQIAKKYGAMFIVLPLEKGVPETAEERIVLIEKVAQKAYALGMSKEDIVIDGLVMTVSAQPHAAKETLKVVEYATQNGFNSILGLSNVSFGLPAREIINSTFLAMAKEKGLTMAICNPADDNLMFSEQAEAVLLGNDEGAAQYIAQMAGITENVQSQKEEDLTLFDAVLKGRKEKVLPLLKEALTTADAKQVLDSEILPALLQAGKKYESGKYFLPQLLQCAESVKTALKVLEPLLVEQNADISKKGKVVLATVQGDIHDIGKNIVGLMLKNHGFDVIDLGKDVPAEKIVKAAKENNADIVGLSALITTTMMEMKTVIDMLKAENLSCKVMVGGAVVNQAFADEIGADGYSPDAIRAVQLAEKMMKKGVN